MEFIILLIFVSFFTFGFFVLEKQIMKAIDSGFIKVKKGKSVLVVRVFVTIIMVLLYVLLWFYSGSLLGI